MRDLWRPKIKRNRIRPALSMRYLRRSWVELFHQHHTSRRKLTPGTKTKPAPSSVAVPGFTWAFQRIQPLHAASSTARPGKIHVISSDFRLLLHHLHRLLFIFLGGCYGNHHHNHHLVRPIVLLAPLVLLGLSSTCFFMLAPTASRATEPPPPPGGERPKKDAAAAAAQLRCRHGGASDGRGRGGRQGRSWRSGRRREVTWLPSSFSLSFFSTPLSLSLSLSPSFCCCAAGLVFRPHSGSSASRFSAAFFADFYLFILAFFCLLHCSVFIFCLTISIFCHRFFSWIQGVHSIFIVVFLFFSSSS